MNKTINALKHLQDKEQRNFISKFIWKTILPMLLIMGMICIHAFYFPTILTTLFVFYVLILYGFIIISFILMIMSISVTYHILKFRTKNDEN